MFYIDGSISFNGTKDWDISDDYSTGEALADNIEGIARNDIDVSWKRGHYISFSTNDVDALIGIIRECSESDSGVNNILRKNDCSIDELTIYFQNEPDEDEDDDDD